MKYDERFSSFCRTVSFKKIPKQSKLIHPQLFHFTYGAQNARQYVRTWKRKNRTKKG